MGGEQLEQRVPDAVGERDPGDTGDRQVGIVDPEVDDPAGLIPDRGVDPHALEHRVERGPQALLGRGQRLHSDPTALPLLDCGQGEGDVGGELREHARLVGPEGSRPRAIRDEPAARCIAVAQREGADRAVAVLLGRVPEGSHERRRVDVVHHDRGCDADGLAGGRLVERRGLGRRGGRREVAGIAVAADERHVAGRRIDDPHAGHRDLARLHDRPTGLARNVAGVGQAQEAPVYRVHGSPEGPSPFELGLRVAQRGDVPAGDDEACHRRRRVTHGRGSDLEVTERAVRSRCVDVPSPFRAGGGRLQHRGKAVGAEHLHGEASGIMADDIVAGETSRGEERRIGVRDDPLEVHDGHAIGGLLERRGELELPAPCADLREGPPDGRPERLEPVLGDVVGGPDAQGVGDELLADRGRDEDHGEAGVPLARDRHRGRAREARHVPVHQGELRPHLGQAGPQAGLVRDDPRLDLEPRLAQGAHDELGVVGVVLDEQDPQGWRQGLGHVGISLRSSQYRPSTPTACMNCSKSTGLTM